MMTMLAVVELLLPLFSLYWVAGPSLPAFLPAYLPDFVFFFSIYLVPLTDFIDLSDLLLTSSW